MTMKKIITILLCLSVMFGTAACGRNQALATIPKIQSSETQATGVKITEAGKAEGKILIAYFSVPEDVDTSDVDAVAGASLVVSAGEKMGNTEYVAQLIHKTLGGDLFRIETAENYPLDHDPLVDQAAKEQEQKARPELSSHIENLDQYETILLGYPNWWGDMPMPVYSFLEEYDFGTKNVIPFITHGGSGASRTIEAISKLQPNAQIQDDALVLSRDEVADSEEAVTAWTEGLGLLSSGD